MEMSLQKVKNTAGWAPSAMIMQGQKCFCNTGISSCSFYTFARIPLNPKTQCQMVWKLFQLAFVGSKSEKPSLCTTCWHIGMSWKLNSFSSLISFSKFLKSYWCSFNTFLRIPLNPKPSLLVQKLFEFAFFWIKKKKAIFMPDFQAYLTGLETYSFFNLLYLKPKNSVLYGAKAIRVSFCWVNNQKTISMQDLLACWTGWKLSGFLLVFFL